MSNIERILEKARASPGSLKFRELRRLAEHYGFVLTRQRGSHVQYKRPNYNKLLTFTDKKGDTHPYQVRSLLNALEELELIDNN